MNESKQCTIPVAVLEATLKVLQSYRDRLGREAEIMERTPEMRNRVEDHRKLIEIIRRLLAFYSGL